MSLEIENKDKTLSSIRDNWKFFVLIFLVGMAYNDSETHKQKFKTLEDRVDKKIRVIYQNVSGIKKIERVQVVDQEKEKLVLYRLNEIEKKLKKQ